VRIVTGTDEETMSTTAAPTVAVEVDQWLSRFGEAAVQGDSGAAARLFGEDCYWRDLVAFSWNITTVEGRPGVREMLDRTLAHTRPRGWHTTEEPTAAEGVNEAWVAFETEVGRGRPRPSIRQCSGCRRSIIGGEFDEQTRRVLRAGIECAGAPARPASDSDLARGPRRARASGAGA
jgi:hypothetical protein